MTIVILAYLAALWALHREKECSRIADALAANWAINTLVTLVNGGWPSLPLFMLVDILTGLWLAKEVGTKTARYAEALFFPMVGVNFTSYFSATLPAWHHDVLSGLAWAQIAAVVWGVWGHDLVQSLGNSVRRVRFALTHAVHVFRGIE